MSVPPPYPRIPHLPPAHGSTRDDAVLTADEAAALLAGAIVVEEKLDGANVLLWRDGERIDMATRGGPGARDRAAQLGPLRAWAARRADDVRRLLGPGDGLYGEWLWLRHSVRYDALPDYLVGLDLWRSDGGFATVEQRDEAFAAAAIAAPPRLFAGRLARGEELGSLLDRSRFGSEPAEGLIVRTPSPERGRPRIAKVVAPGFERRGDELLAAGERNAVAPPR